MKTTIIITFLTLVASVGLGQSKLKWVEGGGSICFGCERTDTVTKSYILQGKDSLTYTIATQNCNCDFYTTIGDHKTMPCKGLKLRAIQVNFMYWTKNITYVKGVKISETKPHWDSNWSQASNIEGVYEQNGKVAYIHSIHLLKHKLINDTKPYKFTSEWVVLNQY